VSSFNIHDVTDVPSLENTRMFLWILRRSVHALPNRTGIQRSLQRCAPRRHIVSEDGRGCTEYNHEHRYASRAATVTARDSTTNADWHVALGDRCSVRQDEPEARSN